jgi:hypothetical protein
LQRYKEKSYRHSAKMIVALIGLMTLLQQGLSKSISTITSGIACLWKNLPYYSLVANCSNGQYHQVLVHRISILVLPVQIRIFAPYGLTFIPNLVKPFIGIIRHNLFLN